MAGGREEGGVTEGNSCFINSGRNCSILGQVVSSRLKHASF